MNLNAQESSMKPVMIDLYCGRGGWTKGFLAHGFECYGYDIEEKFRAHYPGHFIRADAREIPAEELRNFGVKVICASSPCEEFSRHLLPWIKHRPEPVLGIELAQRAFEIARIAGVPLILENVRAAQRWLGKAVTHCGPFYLWGDGVPAMVPRDVDRRFKQTLSSSQRDRRAEIPFELADWMARLYA